MSDYHVWPPIGLNNKNIPDAPRHFDVAIMGAGPAGLCAAIRLLDLGYSVAIVEQLTFPRIQVGESLSPGVRNIFAYLGLDELLLKDAYLNDLPTSVIWEQKAVTKLPGRGNGGNLVVDRGMLDTDLLNTAILRGAFVFQPAKIDAYVFTGDHWQLIIKENERSHKIITTVLLDARGRKGIPATQCLYTAPPTVALWAHVPGCVSPFETRVEALNDGWIWGSPIIRDQYRVMIFTDGFKLKDASTAILFEEFLKNSALFTVSPKQLSSIHTCSVRSYVHHEPWKDNYIRIGEAAFAIDPLSSTGVEKAMRFSLQTVIAVNTFLKYHQPDMARSFYEEKIMESVIAHNNWTRNYYAQSWVSPDAIFWKERSEKFFEAEQSSSDFAMRFKAKMKEHTEISKGTSENIPVSQLLSQLWYQPVMLCPQLNYKNSYCIVNDRIEVKPAISHPRLTREIAYLDQVELKPLLDMVKSDILVSDLMHVWQKHLPVEQAARFIAQLWSMGILIKQ